MPKALDQAEVNRLFEVTINLKHQLILELYYCMGFRINEIVNLKIEEIDSGNMEVLISRGKGKKCRYVTLPESIWADLRKYYVACRSSEFLLGAIWWSYFKRSAQVLFKKALKSGI